MTYQEITPHLNKIAKLNLKNNKRKVGWLYADIYHQISEQPLKEIHCVKVHYGRRLIHMRESIDPKEIRKHCETIAIEDILCIRSSI